MKFTKQVSARPRRQRKLQYIAPLHTRRARLHVHLSKQLRASLERRNVLVAKGDTVKVLRGKFKGASGKVIEVNVKRGLVGVEKLMTKKQGGREVLAMLAPARLLITEVSATRKIKQGGRSTAGKVPAPAVKAAPSKAAPAATV